MLIQELDTPCIIIDQKIAERNINKAQQYFDGSHLKLRPHIKTHKLEKFAKLQIEAGAIGLTCQKISEAEIFANAGFKDILISYNILGNYKLERLVKLAKRTNLSVVADSQTVVEGLSAMFAKHGLSIDILVECDTGMGRCGVQTPEDAQTLAQYINHKPATRFKGIMIYPATNQWDEVEVFCAKTKALCTHFGLNCDIISIGGTPFMKGATLVKTATEHRPGTYIYNDRSLLVKDECNVEDCALTVLSTIVSRPTATRGIIDAGSKSLTSDLLGLEGYGFVKEYPEAKIIGLSEEHGHIDFSACNEKPDTGDKINIIPNHVCPVTNLYDQVHIVEDGIQLEVLPVNARGKVY